MPAEVVHIIEPDGDPGRVAMQIDAACDAMEDIYDRGHYPRLTVHRRWSDHNPEISGQLAHPAVYRWYLHRELSRLVGKGARILVSRSRDRLELTSPLRQLAGVQRHVGADQVPQQVADPR